MYIKQRSVYQFHLTVTPATLRDAKLASDAATLLALYVACAEGGIMHSAPAAVAAAC